MDDQRDNIIIRKLKNAGLIEPYNENNKKNYNEKAKLSSNELEFYKNNADLFSVERKYKSLTGKRTAWLIAVLIITIIFMIVIIFLVEKHLSGGLLVVLILFVLSVSAVSFSYLYVATISNGFINDKYKHDDIIRELVSRFL